MKDPKTTEGTDEGSTPERGRILWFEPPMRAKNLGKEDANVGLDPKLFAAYLIIAGFHIEAGERSFVDFARTLIEEFGNAVRPYLRSLYESVRYYPGFDPTGMSSHAEADEAFRTLGNMPTATSSKAANAPGAKGSVLRLVINPPTWSKSIQPGDRLTAIEWPTEIEALMPPSIPTPIPPHKQ